VNIHGEWFNLFQVNFWSQLQGLVTRLIPLIESQGEGLLGFQDDGISDFQGYGYDYFRIVNGTYGPMATMLRSRQYIED